MCGVSKLTAESLSWRNIENRGSIKLLVNRIFNYIESSITFTLVKRQKLTNTVDIRSY